MFNHQKYRPSPAIDLPNRCWPDQVITKAPDWCSVDLRDGNQALINPMNIEQKTCLFQLLVDIGFKEIEVGFPAASQTEFDFIRQLIEKKLIPDDVCIQVLTQARPDLIQRSFAALAGAKQAIMHVYNSTSTVQREQVFALDRQGVQQIAVQGAIFVRETAQSYPETDWTFQYSPESFTGTELDYAVEVCDAVLNVWQPESGQKAIINLPATVEMTTPNVFADRIEWFCRHLSQREHVRISLHTHNDRGCAVAAAELGFMAGADRIEGTLLGNGERTGNMDIVTMGMNLYSQGIDPLLDFSDMQRIIDVVEYCTELPVPARHPWAGELVYTAFSGSHQDAIRKSMHYHREQQLLHWEVAYLPIDPCDIGREYEAVVRINSQSGKGGVALVLERDYQIQLPKWLHAPLSKVVQNASENSGKEVHSPQIKQLFEQHFIHTSHEWKLHHYEMQTDGEWVSAQFFIGQQTKAIQGRGHGIVEALCDALATILNTTPEIKEFNESAMETGTTAQALACIKLVLAEREWIGVAHHIDISTAALQAVLTAVAHSRY